MDILVFNVKLIKNYLFKFRFRLFQYIYKKSAGQQFIENKVQRMIFVTKKKKVVIATGYTINGTSKIK